MAGEVDGSLARWTTAPRSGVPATEMSRPRRNWSKSLLAEQTERPEHGVGVDADHGRQVLGGWEALSGLRLSVRDRPSDLTGGPRRERPPPSLSRARARTREVTRAPRRDDGGRPGSGAPRGVRPGRDRVGTRPCRRSGILTPQAVLRRALDTLCRLLAWRDVLVAAQDVVRVVAPLERLEAVEGPVGEHRAYPLDRLVGLHVVGVAATAPRPCLDRCCRLARPRDVLSSSAGSRQVAVALMLNAACRYPIAPDGASAPFGAPWSDSNKMPPGGRPSADIRRTSSSISSSGSSRTKWPFQ